MRESFSRTMTLTRRNLKEILRDPLSLIFMLAMPLAMELIFYFLFHNMTAQFEMKSLAPGIVVFAQAFLALFSGLLIAVDRNTAFLTRLYVSRAKPAEFIFGYALAMLPIAFAQAVLFFAVGGAIEPSLFSPGMLWALLLSPVTALFFIGLGILIGSLCGERSVGGVASIAIAGQSLLSGMWYPQEGLGAGMLFVMKCLPFKNATDLINHALNGVGDAFADFWLPLIITLAYAAAAIFAAVLAFRRNMKA
ncbi:MAG: ABC transporter permease [Clostridia bacterium]|nr:ABC transporter permease [Clostridia bacterium]